jgi:RNA polymerase sigma-70 factor, ECF subfamily
LARFPSDGITRLRSGEEEAFSALIKLHGGRLLATARRLFRNEAAGEEAVQKTPLSAFQAIENFSANSRLSTWLHRIVVNHALMKVRSERRHPEQSIGEPLPRFDEEGRRETAVFG